MKTSCSFRQLISGIMTILLTALPIVFCSLAMAEKYTLPIGIPDPGMWGTTHPIDAFAPDTAAKCPDWPSVQTTNCYYIDNTNPQATDTGNTYGYPQKPRLTIPQITYTEGAYVEIHGGPYTSTYLNVKFNGTPDNPVWFRGTSSMPVITSVISIGDSSYAILEYLDCNGMGNSKPCINISAMNAHHICVRHSKFHNKTYTGNSAAIGSVPLQGGSIHDLVFYKNEISELGDWSSAEDQDFHGINPTLWGRTPPTNQYNIWALNNTGYHISGDLFQSNGDQRDITKAVAEGRTITNLDNLHHVYVGKNVSSHSRQQVCTIKLTRDVVVSQNTAYENSNTASGAGGTGILFQEGPDYLWILFNKVYNNQFGVRQGNMSMSSFQNNKTFIIGNIIYNINPLNGTYGTDGINSRYKTAQGIKFEKGNHQRYVIDNTIYNSGGGIGTSTTTENDSAIMSGNVIAGIYGIDILNREDTHIAKFDNIGTTTTDYTYFQPRLDSGKVRFYWVAQQTNTYDSLSAFQSGTGQCQNCWTGDPLFVDSANFDFHPQDNSPLVGKGIRHAVYDEFQTRYGINIAYDFEGKPRPEGAWTLGALEPGTLNTTPLPTPPAPTPTVK